MTYLFQKQGLKRRAGSNPAARTLPPIRYAKLRSVTYHPTHGEGGPVEALTDEEMAGLKREAQERLQRRRRPRGGLWRNQEGTREGKYLVQRRDGSIPEWPYFVIGARDPAA